MITHIVFSSGGIKGISYLGVLRYLYIENIIDNIKYVAGSSIGAYFSVVLALKIPVEFLENELLNILTKIKTENLMSINKNSLINLIEKNGFHKLDFMMNPIILFLKKKYNIEDITFIEFIKKTGVNIYINATNINTTKSKIFSAENTPNISVIDALIASMSVPILFEEMLIDGEYYIDGVLSDDLPLDIFANVPKENILACLLEQSQNDKLKIYSNGTKLDFIQYIYRIMMMMMTTVINNSGIKYKNDEFYILKLKDLPYESTFKFYVKDENINIKLEENDIDNLILKGFIDMTTYMTNRKIM